MSLLLRANGHQIRIVFRSILYLTAPTDPKNMTIEAEPRPSRPRRSVSAANGVQGWKPPRFFRLKRMLLTIAAALISINIWTGAPVLALWVGSQLQGWLGGRAPGTGVSMQGIFAVVALLGARDCTGPSGGQGERGIRQAHRSPV